MDLTDEYGEESSRGPSSAPANEILAPSNAKEKRHLIPVYELSGIKAEQLTELSVRAVSVWFIFYSVSTLFTHPKATER